MAVSCDPVLEPVRFGPLPERDRQKAKYALMIDPLTRAVCSLEEIDRLFEEMWTAERASLEPFD